MKKSVFYVGRLLGRIVEISAYLFLFKEYIYSLYYAMPANDDFALALNWWGHGHLLETFFRIKWNFMNWSGQSGPVSVFFQVFFNPLYWFDNKGHSFGICIIIVNAIIFIGIIAAIQGILKYYFKIENQLVNSIIAFLMIAILTSGFYYNDVYNWWSGLIGYGFMFMLAIQAIKYECRYIAVGNNRDYVCMILLGVLACTSVMCCVPVGIAYLLVIIGNFDYFKNNILRMTLPLGAYVLAGIIVVAAPGNHTRMVARDGGKIPIGESVQTCFELLWERLNEVYYDKKWMVMMLAIILITGLFIEKKASFIRVLLGIIGFVLACVGTILPYVHGNAKTLDSEFAPRAMYMFDYILLLAVAFLILGLGGCLAQIRIDGLAIGKIASVLIAAIFIMSSVSEYEKEDIIQYDLHEKRAIIHESYDRWGQIFEKFSSAKPDSDIFLVEPVITWCPYVYYPGVDSEICDPIVDGDGYANCNQSVAKYFGLSRVAVTFE